MKFIEKIEIMNFQSHKNTVINFSKDINVFLGSSDMGKTSVIRAIKWVMYNEPRGEDFITWNESYCQVSLYMSDGYCVSRIRDKKKNYYLIEKDNQQLEFENFGTDIPIEVSEALGIRKLKIDSDKFLAPNLAEQMDAPFLLSETGTMKGKIISSITKANAIDAAERKTTRDLQQINSELLNKKNDFAIIKDELKKFNNIEKKEINIKKRIELLDIVEKNLKNKDSALLLKDKKEELLKSLAVNKKIIKNKDNVVKLDDLSKNLDSLIKRKTHLINLKNRQIELNQKKKEQENILDKKNIILILDNKYKLFSEKLLRKDFLEKNKESQRKLFIQKKIVLNIINKKDKINQLDEKHKTVINNVIKISQFKNLKSKLQQIKKQKDLALKILAEKKKINELDTKQKNIVENFTKISRLKTLKLKYQQAKQDSIKNQKISTTVKPLIQSLERKSFKLQENILKFSKISKIKEKLALIIKNKKQFVHDYNILQIKESDALNEYNDILKTFDFCPTCNQKIK